MKAFQFTLDRALNWRTAQAGVEKSKVTAAAARVAALQAELESRQTELNAGGKDLTQGAAVPGLEFRTAYLKRLGRDIGRIQKQIAEAERALGVQLKIAVEANRKVRLLEKLKQTRRTEWQTELEREQEAFSGEAFLVRYNRESRRARSSGG